MIQMNLGDRNEIYILCHAASSFIKQISSSGFKLHEQQKLH